MLPQNFGAKHRRDLERRTNCVAHLNGEKLIGLTFHDDIADRVGQRSQRLAVSFLHIRKLNSLVIQRESFVQPKIEKKPGHHG